MPEEIKSVMTIAESHVGSINTANTEFATLGNAPCQDVQINNPAIDMRITFGSVGEPFLSASSYMERDAKKILIMANEFELLDRDIKETFETKRGNL